MDRSRSFLDSSETSVPIDDESTAIITVNLRDSTDLPAPGVQVTLISSRPGSATIDPPSAYTNLDGQAAFTVRSTEAGASEYTASLSISGAIAGTPISVEYEPGSANANSSGIAVYPGTPSLTAGELVTLVLITRDKYGNRRTRGGDNVVFFRSTEAGQSEGTITPASDNGDGSYRGTYTPTVVGNPNQIGFSINSVNGEAVAPITVLP